ncbi:adult cuticle protein 1-like [Calliphora vicina]|uniref:adult cuticle protein 1-like n=1 Tax=Calliphora vicina TaxID=7373 RepID=UPI00325AE827
MKFAIVTLFTLALALGVQSSIIPWGGVVTQVAGGPLAHTSVISPLGLPWGAGVVLGHPHAAISVHGPAAVAVHGPAAIPAAVHVPAVVGGHASYVAKTRGAVHSAPLAGHINSVANVNVAPAPGTW